MNRKSVRYNNLPNSPNETSQHSPSLNVPVPGLPSAPVRAALCEDELRPKTFENTHLLV